MTQDYLLALRSLLPYWSHVKMCLDALLPGETLDLTSGQESGNGPHVFKSWDEYWNHTLSLCPPERASFLREIFKQWREYEFCVTIGEIPETGTTKPMTEMESLAGRALTAVLRLPNEVLERHGLAAAPICEGSPDREMV